MESEITSLVKESKSLLTVLILILMEFEITYMRLGHQLLILMVLILILMEFEITGTAASFYQQRAGVLILILMEFEITVGGNVWTTVLAVMS